jgi:hypothetical protein
MRVRTISLVWGFKSRSLLFMGYCWIKIKTINEKNLKNPDRKQG